MKSISKGCAQFNINQKILKSAFVPLPPLEEQKRIVDELKKFEPLIADYDKLEQQATKLDSEIYDKLKIGKKRVYYYNNSIASAKSIYSGDKEAYSEATFNEEEYTICWKPEERTQTKKGKTKDEHEELLVKLIQRLGTHPVTGYEALPYGCTYNGYKITKRDIATLNNTITRILNDESPLPLCSEKQAYWCAKFLGVDKEVAMNLNKYQASDILNVYFEKIPVTQEEYDDVKAFYIAKLKKFI
jgi:restriction endonuclease S subunit